MRTLTINNLNFCENELPSESQVKGGLKYSATYSTSKDSAKSSGYVAAYYIGSTGPQYVVGAYVSGAVAGGVAGAIAVGGTTYTSSGAVAGTF